jgi:RNA polymerase sigma-70 factor (ECF subfamily)
VSGDDRLLVQAARNGDRRAFGALFERYSAMVHGILLARVSPRFVDDLMQDVFVAALERIASVQKADAFGGWLAAIARNRATDFHRTKKPMVELDDEAVPASGGGAARLEAERILRAIQTLSDAYRETLVLRLVEGMSGPEIAERVGMTPESVRVNLHRGMKMLRERLGIEADTKTEEDA